jgi:hypothetical protein
MIFRAARRVWRQNGDRGLAIFVFMAGQILSVNVHALLGQRNAS